MPNTSSKRRIRRLMRDESFTNGLVLKTSDAHDIYSLVVADIDDTVQDVVERVEDYGYPVNLLVPSGDDILCFTIGKSHAIHDPQTRRSAPQSQPKQAGDWILLPPGGSKGTIPSCAGHGLSKSAQKWWRTIWRSPMGTQWNESHIPALLELAILRDAANGRRN